MTPDAAMREVARRLGCPVAFFDLETTGTNKETDRIVEIAIARATADEVVRRSRLVNPGRPIPPGATAVHGITDEMVRDAPRFGQIARGVADILAGSALVAFNGIAFDMPLLAAEMARAGVPFDPEDFEVVDPCVIFRKQSPRDLGAALVHYCGEVHDGAHRSDADVNAMARVLAAQLDRPDMPGTAAELARYCRPDGAIDRDGKFVWRDGVAVIAFGKHEGTPLEDVDPGYLRWMRDQKFGRSTVAVVEAALRGEYPTAPEAAQRTA
jgi:DNA polymerase-3 subunit epsilon